MKKNIHWGILILLAVALVFVLSEKKATLDTPEASVIIQEIEEPLLEDKEQNIPAVEREVIKAGPLVTPEVAHSDTSFFVDNKEYPVFLGESKTALAVMNQLSETTDFRYSGKDFSGLGFFVESINGTKSEGGMYWILYVNGVLAGEGVSQLIVKPGDRIEWRYEAEK